MHWSRTLFPALLSVLLLAGAGGQARAASPPTVIPSASPRPAENPGLGGGAPARARHSDQLSLPAAVQASARSAGLAVGGAGGGPVPFLTRPYFGWHSLNSWFDHCNPDYSIDGRICNVDGTVAVSSNGVDPGFTKGYAITPRGSDYLYYDGHNGFDLGLSYEQVLAAAPGLVTTAGVDPVPYNSCFGNTVVIDHGNGFSTRYAHLSQVDVSVGEMVTRGQLIAVSGTSGCSTGPHLHFGFYLNSSWTSIDPWGWLGAAGADPWSYDQGDMWLTGNPHDPIPDAPTQVQATVSGQNVTVAWTPGFDGGLGVTGFTVTAAPGGVTATAGPGASSLVFPGLQTGVPYTFTVTATNPIGSSSASAASDPVTLASSSTVQYFAFYDLSSPSVVGDNIHIVNPGSSAATGSVSIAGVASATWAAAANGGEAIVNFPRGTAGGPVAVTASTGVLATQRVQYLQSFNEIPAQPATAAQKELFFPWYDRISSLGFTADNIHVVNPGTAPAHVSATIPGQPGCSPTATIAGGGAAVLTCATGFGGPVVIGSDLPVLASQRVSYFQSFNETWAQSAATAATAMSFPWYDRISSAGFLNDNIHLVNPGSIPATVTVATPGVPVACSRTVVVAARGQLIVNCPTGFGGPVRISSNVNVLASQRVQYFNSFNEVPAQPLTAAATRLYFPWYDRISDPGFQADNIHLVNPGPVAANVTVSIPGQPAGCSPTDQAIPPGGEIMVSCATGFGGPVKVVSNVPVMASQRVQYYQSFNESAAGY